MQGLARVWVYQANKKFAQDQKEFLSAGLRDLCEEWSAHGAPLHTSFTLSHDQFVIMFVDEQHLGASGCSIDNSVRFLKSLQDKIGLDFFNRTQVAFLLDGSVVLYDLAELKTLFENHTLSGNTITFNNLVNNKEEWEKQWQVPAKNSWMARYLPKSVVAP